MLETSPQWPLKEGDIVSFATQATDKQPAERVTGKYLGGSSNDGELIVVEVATDDQLEERVFKRSDIAGGLMLKRTDLE